MVEQIDRDAAARFVRKAWHLFWPNDYERAMQDAKDMQAGLCDTWALVQAFDWHRQAAEARILAAFRQPDAAMVEAVAKVLHNHRSDAAIACGRGKGLPSWQHQLPEYRNHVCKEATAALAAAADHMEAGDAG
jgi:hypothetical protein